MKKEFFIQRINEIQKQLDEINEVIFFLKKNTKNYSKIKELEKQKQELISLKALNGVFKNES